VADLALVLAAKMDDARMFLVVTDAFAMMAGVDAIVPFDWTFARRKCPVGVEGHAYRMKVIQMHSVVNVLLFIWVNDVRLQGFVQKVGDSFIKMK
jgi:hypothetical protein